jgi:hypothetical protein
MYQNVIYLLKSLVYYYKNNNKCLWFIFFRSKEFMLYNELDNIRQERLKNDISLIRKMIENDLDTKIKNSVKKYNEMMPYKSLQLNQKPMTVNE